jgi:hypothetical protein
VAKRAIPPISRRPALVPTAAPLLTWSKRPAKHSGIGDCFGKQRSVTTLGMPVTGEFAQHPPEHLRVQVQLGVVGVSSRNRLFCTLKPRRPTRVVGLLPIPRSRFLVCIACRAPHSTGPAAAGAQDNAARLTGGRTPHTYRVWPPEPMPLPCLCALCFVGFSVRPAQADSKPPLWFSPKSFRSAPITSSSLRKALGNAPSPFHGLLATGQQLPLPRQPPCSPA